LLLYRGCLCAAASGAGSAAAGPTGRRDPESGGSEAPEAQFAQAWILRKFGYASGAAVIAHGLAPLERKDGASSFSGGPDSWEVGLVTQVGFGRGWVWL